MFIQPYLYLARLNKPIGIFLLLIPCYWGLALGSHGFPHLKWLILFALGATIMRGAGCTLNDIWDRSFDKQVKRTLTRPLASDQLTTQQALLFFILQCFLGLFVFLQLPSSAQFMSLIAFGLLLTYPLAKRWTYWPQLILGLAFNSGVFIGWLTVVDLPLHVFLSLISSFSIYTIGLLSWWIGLVILSIFIIIISVFSMLYSTLLTVCVIILSPIILFFSFETYLFCLDRIWPVPTSFQDDDLYTTSTLLEDIFTVIYKGLEFYWAQVNQLLENWHFIKVTYGFDITTLFLFYLAGICWTLAYDTIYAYPDKEDDQKIGLKSIPVKFQEDTSVIVLIF
ncbi:MAG: 4-hydroxybenzoate octaprenyltransferase, partial [Proteobacteria bacterium]|nr:4-hydroxybenzoate octaprenyltransferase [Pseudomonadota bacterium]